MTNLSKLLLAVAATGCTEPSAPNLACLDEAHAFTSGPLDDGFVLDELGGKPIFGALVQVHSATALLDEAVSAMDGRYRLSAEASGQVVRHAMADGYLDAYAHDPIARGTSMPLPMIRREDADRLAMLAGVAADPMKGMVLAIVQDCAKQPVEGATIEAASAEAVLYLDAATHFDPTLTSTSTDSAALLINVPVGATDIEIDIGGVAYPAATVETHANALVTVWRRPNG